MALELLRASTVDVTVSDIRMPRLDGPGLLYALRASGDVTPLVFLTGYGDYSDQELIHSGAAAVLGKPVSLATLMQALDAARRG